MSNINNALNLYQKAEKKLRGWNPFSSKEEKHEEAAELFQQAGHIYKISKDWVLAGDAYLRGADCLRAIKSFETTTLLLAAANCYRNVGLTIGADKNLESVDLRSNLGQKTISCYEAAHDLALDDGKFTQAARYLKEIAEIYESNQDLKEALIYYEKAADLYETENDNSQIQCWTKIANLMTTKEIGNFAEAIKIYEKLVNKSIDNNLLKFKTKEYLFKAGLSWLSLDDMVGATRALDRYDTLDASFQDSREAKFLREIIENIKRYDVDGFTNAVIEYDSVTHLDPWTTQILLIIKRLIWKEESSTFLNRTPPLPKSRNLSFSSDEVYQEDIVKQPEEEEHEKEEEEVEKEEQDHEKQAKDSLDSLDREPQEDDDSLC